MVSLLSPLAEFLATLRVQGRHVRVQTHSAVELSGLARIVLFVGLADLLGCFDSQGTMQVLLHEACHQAKEGSLNSREGHTLLLSTGDDHCQDNQMNVSVVREELHVADSKQENRNNCVPPE